METLTDKLVTAAFSVVVDALATNAATFVAFIVGTILAALGVHYAAKSYRLSRKFADEKPKLTIGFYGDYEAHSLVAFFPFKRGRIFLAPLQMSIRNNGTIAAKEVELVLDISDSIFGRDLERSVGNIAKARGMNIVSERGRNKNITRVYIRVGSLPPSMGFILAPEMVVRESSELEDVVAVTASDKKKLSVRYRAQFAYVMDVTVVSDTTSPVRKTFDLTVRKGDEKKWREHASEESKIVKTRRQRISTAQATHKLLVFFREFERVANGRARSPPCYRAVSNELTLVQVES